MVTIISGTNRPESRSLAVAQIVKACFAKHKIDSQVMDLCKIPLNQVDGSQYRKNQPPAITQAINTLHKSRGYVIVCPEYNGSMPGALKYFIDHWDYPRTFEYVPVAFVGLGGRFGGVRPVEHLQQVFSYRNAFLFPQRVFIFNVWDVLKDGKIMDPAINQMLDIQALDFGRFITGLEHVKLHALHRG